VTLLTGFLGSGKTTLVNRLLTQAHGRRLGVIVNEFGQLGIDGALIARSAGPVIELANGCVCCATRGDLFATLNEVMAGPQKLDGILIETSGLANPGPVIDDLEQYQLTQPIRFDSVVTVIDAENFDRNLDAAEAAFEQITLGDLLLVNKTDLVSVEIGGLIEKGLRKLNPAARVLHCVECEVPLDTLLGVERQAGHEAPHGHSHAHDHDHHHTHSDFDSIVARCERPLDPVRFTAWLDGLPSTIFRVKGFVRLAGSDDEVIVHVVGKRKSIEPASGPGRTEGATLVLIGRALASQELQAGLSACAA
jgi:G3E family GTPase